MNAPAEFQAGASAATGHCPLLVADYLVARSGGRLTPLQVIKLTYIAHGYSLAINGEPLVDEAVEAWRHGPVVPSVYHRAKRCGGGRIGRLLYSEPAPARRTAPSLSASPRGAGLYWTRFWTSTGGLPDPSSSA